MSRSTTVALKRNWKATWSSPSQRTLMIAGSALVAVILSFMPAFFQNIEKRPGVQLHDWVLARVGPADVSIWIFMIIWSMGLLTLVRAIHKPYIYVRYVWLYCAICLTRMLAITLVPLAAPIGLVELVDPLTGVFYGHAVITKDLFFSGHMSTLVSMIFCLPRKNDKIAVAIASCVVACLLLIQHVHYTIDVLAAPLVVFLLHRLLSSALFANSRP